MALTTRFRSPAGALRVKSPWLLVSATMPVPVTAMVAPVTPCWVEELVTRPVTWRTWAVAIGVSRRQSEKKMPHTRSVMAPPTFFRELALQRIGHYSAPPLHWAQGGRLKLARHTLVTSIRRSERWGAFCRADPPTVSPTAHVGGESKRSPALAAVGGRSGGLV